MSSLHAHTPPSQEQGLLLHRRLCEGDKTASTEFAEAYLYWLIHWLEEYHRHTPDELREQAAADAILAFIKNPQAYDPGRMELTAYLRMAAQGDLRNLLSKEQRRQKGRVPWNAVEDDPDGGKYLQKEDDPFLALLSAETEQEKPDLIQSLLEQLNEVERQVFALMLQGERRTPVFAEVLGLVHLPAKEQEDEVYRVKDRIMTRLKRGAKKR